MASQVTVEQCFDSFLDTSITDRFDRLTDCVKLYRSNQPLTVPESRFNYSQYHNINETLMALEYIAQEKPAGVNLDTLNILKGKARTVHESDHCKNEFPLGKVWCSRMRRLSQLKTEATSVTEDFRSDILDEDYRNYLTCARFAGEDPNEERLNACRETCKPGHMYRFTCDTLAQIEGTEEKNPRITRYQDSCYGDNVERNCRTLCEDYNELSACNPNRTAAVLRGFREDESSRTPVSSASVPRENGQNPQQPTIVGDNNTVVINQGVANPSLNYEPVNPYYNEGTRGYRNNTQNFRRQNIGSVSVNQPNVNIKSRSRIGNLKGGTLSLDTNFSATTSGSTLSPNTLLPPVKRGSISTKTKQSPNRNQSRMHPASFSAGQSIGGSNSTGRSAKSSKKIRVSRRMPYKKYRDNLGGNVYYGIDGSLNTQRNNKSKKKKSRQVSSGSRGSSALPSPEAILRLNRQFKNGFPRQRMFLSPTESIFDGLSKAYDDVKKRQILNENGQ